MSILGGIFLILSSAEFAYTQEENALSVGETMGLGEFKVFAGEESELSPHTNTVDKKDLEQQSPTGTGDLLKQIPGISAVRRGSVGSDPVLRGLREDQLNVLIDGARIWGACPGRMDPPSSHIDPEELEAVEVSKGPYSVRQGPGVLGGSINLITPRPKRWEEFNLHGSLSAGFESVSDGKSGRARLWGGDRPYSFRLSLGSRNYEDYNSGRGKVEDSRFEETDYSTKLWLFPNQRQEVGFSLSQAFGRDIRYPGKLMDTEESDTTRIMLDYSWNNVTPYLFSLQAKLYYNEAEHIMSNKHKDPKPGLMKMPIKAKTSSDTYGGRLETQWAPDERSFLSLGLDFYRLDRNAISKMTMMGMESEKKIWPDAFSYDAGLFVEYHRELTREWEFTVGARIDAVEADAKTPDPEALEFWGRKDLREKETNWAGNIGLSYNPLKTLEFFGAVGRGVRSADATERYSFFFPSSRFADNFDYIGDPGLEPEESLELDVGARASGEKASAEITLFYALIDDYIIGEVIPDLKPRTPGALGVKQYSNTDAIIQGVECWGEYHLLEEFLLKGSLAYTRGKDKQSGRPLPYMPPLEGKVALRYETAWLGFWSELGGRLAKRKERVAPEFGEEKTPGFATFSITGGINPYPGYTLLLGVENIFDKYYSEHLNARNPITGERVPEPGRNVYVVLKYEF